MQDADKILVLLQQGDEVLDYREAQRYYSGAALVIIGNARQSCDGRFRRQNTDGITVFIGLLKIRKQYNVSQYTAQSLEVLSGLDPVHRRPACIPIPHVQTIWRKK